MSAFAMTSMQSSFVARPSALSARPASARAAVCFAIRAEAAGALRAMSTEDLKKKIDDKKRELFDLRMKQGTRQEFKPSDFPGIRKDVARMKTIIREREIEQGVKPRESRNIKTKELLARYPPNKPANQKAVRNKK